jgi:2-haloacid dehalogenase
MADHWATFDCYGTLIDWEAGLGAALGGVWPGIDADRLLAHYHAVEPRVQAERSLPYREVMARCLAAIAAIEGLEVPAGRRDELARSLPSWSPFAEVPPALTEARDRGWKLAILSNADPDLLAASVRRIGVAFDLLVTAADADSYKPAIGHWRRFRELAGEPGIHVHVAASAYHDLAPCAELGVRAVWINRLEEPSELPRAAELPDLVGLADVLDRVSANPG